MPKGLEDPKLEQRFLAFQDAHPELTDKLALWLADAGTLELEDSEAAALFRKTFPELMD